MHTPTTRSCLRSDIFQFLRNVIGRLDSSRFTAVGAQEMSRLAKETANKP